MSQHVFNVKNQIKNLKISITGLNLCKISKIGKLSKIGLI
jgi:hypothetical protein